MLCRTKL